MSVVSKIINQIFQHLDEHFESDEIKVNLLFVLFGIRKGYLFETYNADIQHETENMTRFINGFGKKLMLKLREDNMQTERWMIYSDLIHPEIGRYPTFTHEIIGNILGFKCEFVDTKYVDTYFVNYMLHNIQTKNTQSIISQICEKNSYKSEEHESEIKVMNFVLGYLLPQRYNMTMDVNFSYSIETQVNYIQNLLLKMKDYGKLEYSDFIKFQKLQSDMVNIMWNEEQTEYEEKIDNVKNIQQLNELIMRDGIHIIKIFNTYLRE